MMERIKEIWKQLEANNSATAGLLKLRFSETSKCDVFLGLKNPEAHRMLIIKTPFTVGKEFNFRYEFRGLKFEKVYDPDDSRFLLLNLILVDNQFKDIFDSLITDIIGSIIGESDIVIIFKNYSNRLVKWQSLFERFRQQGLTQEEQQGLYGEIFFLRKFLKFNCDYQNILSSWLGPEKQIRDFQFGSWSVEIKTTQGNNHQKVHISSERQLDINTLENLFLCHLSLEVRQKDGETLNELIDDTIEILKADFSALNKFEAKLMEGGYFEHHKQMYSDLGYFIRQESFYKVEKKFPRIEEADIRKGVGDVKYSIIVSQCLDYLVDEEKLFQTLIFL